MNPTLKELPDSCPFCNMSVLRNDDVIGLVRAEFACGLVLTTTLRAGAEWKIKTQCTNAATRLLQVLSALREIVPQLLACNYECVAGPLEHNVEFMRLAQIADQKT